MTEEEVKLRLINPALSKKGWNEWRIGMEQMPSKRIAKQDIEFSDGQILLEDDKIKRGKKKRCDYVLYSFDGFALAIIEAKDDSHTMHDGLQQAMEYAKGFGCAFAYSSNGSGFVEYDFFTGKQRKLKLDEFPSEEELLERFYQGSGDKNATQTLQKQALQEQNDFLTPREQIPLNLQNLISQPYFLEEKFPRYYQAAAVNKAIEAVATGQKRILLVMATGTGKTYTAFELIYRLYKAGKIKKILYLADRNNLIDQTMANDFKPLFKESTKIERKQIDNSHPLCFALYQQFITFKDDEIIKNFENYAKDAFDFILIDECHRSSSKEDSAYREILEYFSPAIQVGMTATPRHKELGSNLDYFGNPVYHYGLKNGIEDGFLAPFKVIKYYNSLEFSTHKNDNETTYNESRIELAAKEITKFLKESLKDRYAKTIVFCKDQHHASLMAQALRNENSDLCAKHSDYVERITSNEPEVKEKLEKFINIKSTFPVIVTTSRLLSTGADTKMTKLIVLDTKIESEIEFTQIIGRGTRVNEDAGKMYFTILDFCGTANDFSKILDEIPLIKGKDFPKQKPKEVREGIKTTIKGEEVFVIATIEQIWGQNGELIATNFTDYTKMNLKKEFLNLKDFLTQWNAADRKSEILNLLESKGILINELRAKEEFKDKDEFDILISLAFNQKAISRKERAKKASKFLAKFEGKAREVLEILLDKYTQNGITDIENPRVLQNKPFEFINIPQALEEIFGSTENYKQILNELKKELYEVA